MIKDIRIHPRLLTTIMLNLPHGFTTVPSDTGELIVTFTASDDYLQDAITEMEQYLPAMKDYLKSIPGRNKGK